jgi:curved DNA-binding protein CbpA
MILMDRRTALEILGLQEAHTREELKAAYKRGCLRYHPDKTRRVEEDAEMFHKVQAAHGFLSEEESVANQGSFGHKDLINFLLWFALNVCRPQTEASSERVVPQSELIAEVTLREVYEAVVKRLVYKRISEGVCRTETLFLELVDFRDSYLLPGKGDNGGSLLVKTKLIKTAEYYLDDLLCSRDLYVTREVSLYEHYYGPLRPIVLPNEETLPVEEREPSNPLPEVESWCDRGLPYEDEWGDIKRGCLYVINKVNLRANNLGEQDRDPLRRLFPPQ